LDQEDGGFGRCFYVCWPDWHTPLKTGWQLDTGIYRRLHDCFGKAVYIDVFNAAMDATRDKAP
jgi:hypothetical protein